MRILLLLSLLAGLSTQATPQSAVASSVKKNADDVQVRLSAADDKTTFRIGEPIQLVLTFTSKRPDHNIMVDVPEFEGPLDAIEIAPSRGVVRWIDDYVALHRSYRDVTVLMPASETVAVQLPLNYWFRFDEPGEFTIRVKTHRVRIGMDAGSSAPLTTNTISLRVVPMSEREEEEEARRLSAQLTAMQAEDLTEGARICRALAFLVGEAGAREKARLIVSPPRHSTGECYQAMQMGMHITKNPETIRTLLEEALLDPGNSASKDVVEMLADLRLWSERAVIIDGSKDEHESQQRAESRHAALREEYLDDIVRSMPARAGQSRRGTASTILMMVSSGLREKRPLPKAVRQLLIDEFNEFDTSGQLSLVSGNWEDIRDKSLFSPVAALLGKVDPMWRGSVLQAMIDIAPADAKPFAIQEIIRQSVDLDDVKALPDAMLPELDHPLLAALTKPIDRGQPRSKYLFNLSTSFIARFASASILGEVTAFYDEHRRSLEEDAQVNLLSYLDRWNESATRPLIERALEETRDTLFVYHLAEARYGGSVAAILKARLESDDPEVVSQTANVMQQSGTADVRGLIWARLASWRRDWQGRDSALQSTSGELTAQGHVELALVQAWLFGSGWKYAEADRKTVGQGCVTKTCRDAYR